MAEPDLHPGVLPASDLRDRIQERVEARRALASASATAESRGFKHGTGRRGSHRQPTIASGGEAFASGVTAANGVLPDTIATDTTGPLAAIPAMVTPSTAHAHATATSAVVATAPRDTIGQTRQPRYRRTSHRRQRRQLPAFARFLVLVASAAVGVVLLRAFVIASFYIPSGSMELTLHGCTGCEPDMVMVDKTSYRFGSPSRKDIVVFARPPLAPTTDKDLIKRIIGLPGETVSGHDGKVFINGSALTEGYVDPTCHGTADFPAVTVPAGQYFMMGDNRCDSFDSRSFGTVPRGDLVGRAFAVIWPIKHLAWL